MKGPLHLKFAAPLACKGSRKRLRWPVRRRQHQLPLHCQLQKLNEERRRRRREDPSKLENKSIEKPKRPKEVEFKKMLLDETANGKSGPVDGKKKLDRKNWEGSTDTSPTCRERPCQRPEILDGRPEVMAEVNVEKCMIMKKD